MSDDDATTATQWRSSITDPPPEGVPVEVRNNGGAVLVRQRGLWFLPDFSMYVYYSPEWWRPLPSGGRDADDA